MSLSLQRWNRDRVELLREAFALAWARTDQLFAIVAPARMLAQPIVWRHPIDRAQGRCSQALGHR
jgi:hypothetical protein